MSVDISDKGGVKNRNTNIKNKKVQDGQDLKSVMSTKYGRRVIHSILMSARIFTCSFAANGDSHITAFNEGRRSLGCELLQSVDRFPDEYNLMMVENRIVKSNNQGGKNTKGDGDNG